MNKKELNNISIEMSSFFKNLLITIIFSIVGLLLANIFEREILIMSKTELEIMLSEYISSLISAFKILCLTMPLLPIIRFSSSKIINIYRNLSDKEKEAVQKTTKTIGYTIIGYWVLDKIFFKNKQ